VIDYSAAQAQYRAAKASGNGDVVMHAENTFRDISQEILSRQDPRLVEAWEVCERYRVSAPHDQHDMRMTSQPQFVRDCENIDRRYGAATSAIRRETWKRGSRLRTWRPSRRQSPGVPEAKSRSRVKMPGSGRCRPPARLRPRGGIRAASLTGKTASNWSPQQSASRVTEQRRHCQRPTRLKSGNRRRTTGREILLRRDPNHATVSLTSRRHGNQLHPKGLR